MKGTDYNRIKEKQIERFTKLIVDALFDSNSIDEDKLILTSIENSINSLQSQLNTIAQQGGYLYSKRYDLTDPNISDDLNGDNLSYDSELLLTKNNGKFTINLPRTSSYYLYLHINNYPNATYLTANNVQYPIQEEMTIKFDNASQIAFSTDNYIWLSEISVTEYKLPEVPTRLSQLENDQRFIASEVIEQTETIKLIIKEQAQHPEGVL